MEQINVGRESSATGNVSPAGMTEGQRGGKAGIRKRMRPRPAAAVLGGPGPAVVITGSIGRRDNAREPVVPSLSRGPP